jgi:hypothetical protein
MKDDNYRIWVEDLGTFRSRRTKYVGPEDQMKRRRKMLQAYMDRTYGDGVKRVYIALDSGEQQPMIIRTATFRCYDGIGNLVPGYFTEEEARQLVAANEEWTYSEVI